MGVASFWVSRDGERLSRFAHCEGRERCERRENWYHGWFRYRTQFFLPSLPLCKIRYVLQWLQIALILPGPVEKLFLSAVVLCASLFFIFFFFFFFASLYPLSCFVKFQFLCCSVLGFLFRFRISYVWWLGKMQRSSDCKLVSFLKFSSAHMNYFRWKLRQARPLMDFLIRKQRLLFPDYSSSYKFEENSKNWTGIWCAFLEIVNQDNNLLFIYKVFILTKIFFLWILEETFKVLKIIPKLFIFSILSIVVFHQ